MSKETESVEKYDKLDRRCLFEIISLESAALLLLLLRFQGNSRAEGFALQGIPRCVASALPKIQIHCLARGKSMFPHTKHVCVCVSSPFPKDL